MSQCPVIHARRHAQPSEHQRRHRATRATALFMLADTRSQASINAATVQHELRNNDLILQDYGHLKYKRIDDPRPEPTLESDEDWQAMNCVLDNGVRILSRSRGQKIRGLNVVLSQYAILTPYQLARSSVRLRG
jgi:hypothetical protein